MATIEEIKELREMTGAGVNAVREALEVSKGNKEEAMKYLREKGVAKAEKRQEKSAVNGILGTYVHSNKKVVTVVEVNCETDFAANSEDFIKFANDLAVHVAAMNPKFINTESVSKEEIEAIKQTAKEDLEGKPAEVQEKILEGKLTKHYQDIVLVKQNLFQDDSKTVEDYKNELVAKIGEKIEIKSFNKFEVSVAPVSCSVE